MKKIQKPPHWRGYLTSELIKKIINSQELTECLKHFEEEYVYWEKFRFYPLPKGISSEQAWSYLKLSRRTIQQNSPIQDVNGDLFRYSVTKVMYQFLSFIDSNTSGFLASDLSRPTSVQKSQLIVSGLTEEAIASSQLEGANTSRKVAKEMLLNQRKARNRDEQMIINNYQVMQRLQEWKNIPLSIDILLTMQKNLTSQTMDREVDSGRFRLDADEIVVADSLTGDIVYSPPAEKRYKKELDRFIQYANTDEKDTDFVHHVIKGIILHFWLAYLHPFVDGNGRTARAIFYWYMLRKNYWLFQYLSVSRIIKQSKTGYDNAFLYSEYDENDLTYFLYYNLQSIVKSIKSFEVHYREKIEKGRMLEKLSGNIKIYNERQISLLHYFNENKEAHMDIAIYKAKNNIAYETARTDLSLLVDNGLVERVQVSNKFVFIPHIGEIVKLFKTVS
jgi:Fic family protein